MSGMNPNTQAEPKRVQTYGRKRNAVAVALVKPGRGSIRVNGAPLDLISPPSLRVKIEEPILVIGKEKFVGLDMKIRVRGGGSVAQIYAIRQAVAKGIVAWHQKYEDEQSKKEIRDQLILADRSLLIADPRRCEPKKFGGASARARYQKSYR